MNSSLRVLRPWSLARVKEDFPFVPRVVQPTIKVRSGVTSSGNMQPDPLTQINGWFCQSTGNIVVSGVPWPALDVAASTRYWG